MFALYASRAGLTLWVRALKSGKYVSAAIRQPAMMIYLRPILSESQPKKMKNGVPMSSEMPISM